MKGGMGRQKAVCRLQTREGCAASLGGWEVLGQERNAWVSHHHLGPDRIWLLAYLNIDFKGLKANLAIQPGTLRVDIKTHDLLKRRWSQKDLLPQDKTSKSKRRHRLLPNSSEFPETVKQETNHQEGNGDAWTPPAMLGTKGQLEFWPKVVPLELGIDRTREKIPQEKKL